MTPDWIYFLITAISLSTTALVCFAVLWLRKLRDNVSAALSEAAKQQIYSVKRMSEAIAQLQKQQDNYTRQINALAQAGLRLQQELSNVSTRLGNTRAEDSRGGRTVH